MATPKLRFKGFTEDWSKTKIQKLIDDKYLISHLDGNHGSLYPKSSEFSKDGVPYITANDIQSGEVSFESCKFLPEERASTFKKGKAKDGDLIFAHNATVGPVGILKTNLDYVILSTTVTYFRFDNTFINTNFIKSSFESHYFVKQYSKVMSQSTRNQVPITAQRKFFLALPCLPEQQKIASFLTAVDKRISLLQRKATLLEDYKKGVMQKLFSQELRFKDDHGQDFPDWEEKKLASLCEIKKGKQLNKEFLTEEGLYPCQNGGIEPSGYTSNFNTVEDTITISEGGNSCGFVNFMKTKFWCGGHCYSILNLAGYVDIVFLYQSLKYNQNRIMRLRVGSGLPNIQKGDLSKLILKIPIKKEQQKIASFLESLDKKIETVNQQIEGMQTFKKGLLQQMFV